MSKVIAHPRHDDKMRARARDVHYAIALRDTVRFFATYSLLFEVSGQDTSTFVYPNCTEPLDSFIIASLARRSPCFSRRQDFSS